MLSDINVSNAAQMIFLSESMTAIMLAAFEEDARNDPEVGGMPMTFLDGYVALFMPMIGFNMVQSICALKDDAEPKISDSCPWTGIDELANFDDFATTKSWTVAAKRPLSEFYELKYNMPYSVIASYTMEDIQGREYESREPYLSEVMFTDTPSSALAGVAAAGLALVATLAL